MGAQGPSLHGVNLRTKCHEEPKHHSDPTLDLNCKGRTKAAWLSLQGELLLSNTAMAP
jgi:hypothetical protein